MPRNAIDDGSIPERDEGRRSGPGSRVKLDLTVLERGAPAPKRSPLASDTPSRKPPPRSQSHERLQADALH